MRPSSRLTGFQNEAQHLSSLDERPRPGGSIQWLSCHGQGVMAHPTSGTARTFTGWN